MHSLFPRRLYRILMTLIPLTALVGCGEGDGPARIFNEPAAPFDGPPASCFEALTFEDICDQVISFVEFEGAPGRIVDNPDQSGINTSAKVAEFVKRRAQSGATFGGTIVDFSASGADQIDPGDFITVKVWSQRPVNLLVEPEGGGPGSGQEVRHGGTGWEELTFNFNFSGTTSGYVFIFDNGTNGDGGTDPLNWTFYADDISEPMGGGGAPATTLPVDFEADPATYDFGPDGGFGGGASDVIANPDQSGINSSAQTARMQKFAGEVFGGSTLNLGSNVDFSAGEVFTMKVWSTRVVPVLFKFEGLDQERSVDHGGSGGWEELCFDFTGSTAGPASSAITFIFDLGVNGDAINDPSNWTFYYDDIQQVASCPTGGGGGTATAVDFEDTGAPYAFGDFGGGVAQVVDNPDASGINTSPKTAQMQKFAGEVFGGSTLTLPAGIDFSAGEAFTVKVWSTRVVPVLFKLEGLNQERSVSHGGSGGWEELCFDFTGSTAGPASSAITFIFDLGVNGDATNDPDNWTFYFDDVQQVASCPTGGGGSGSADFESGSAAFADFGGGVATVIANPDVSGINTSAQVGQMQKFAGETFAGSTLDLGGAVPFAAGDSYTMKVRASRSVVVTLKLEPLNEERTATHSGSGTWEELCFDFTGVSGNVTGLTLIFDNGTAGDAANDPDNWTFQFDDIVQTSNACPTGGGGGTALGPVDFEPGGLGSAFAWTVFENGDNPPIQVIGNPDASGANTSATVAQFTARQAGQPFAGAVTSDLPTFTLDASNAIVKILVWKTEISDVGIKFETASQASTGEIKVPNTVTNQWEELTFDFSGKIGEPSSTDITGLVLFPDFNARTQDNVIYFDDISFSAVGGGGGSTATAVDFEDAGAPYAFSDFGGGAAQVIDNPDASGINTSPKVGQMEKFAGEVFGGSTLALPADIDFSAGEVFSMKVWAARNVPVLFKLEGLLQERSVNQSGSSSWEELCFDFTGSTSGPASAAITLIFDLGVNGAAASDPSNWTFYFDDIQQAASCPGGGGGGGSAAAVDFESPSTGAGFTWSVFENADNPPLQIISNPDLSGANTSAMVARFTARVGGQPFAGVETAHGDIGPLTLDSSNSIIKVLVWKPVISDVGIKFAIANGGAQPEIKVANTVVNQWEELTFDFSGNIGLAESIDIDQLIVFPDFDLGGRAQDNVVYFDNIRYTDGT